LSGKPIHICGRPQPWRPGQPLASRCRASTVLGRGTAKNDGHDAPHEECTCGIYAVKTRQHFRGAGYERYGIYGEVYLWGKVVEHELGYRAQFAYPKNFVVPLERLPLTLAEIRPRVQALTLFRSDIFVLANDETIPLWGRSSGFDPAVLDCLSEVGKVPDVCRKRERIIRRGDPLRVLGRGTAVVEHISSSWIQAVVLNRCTLRIARKSIRWSGQRRRWETTQHPCAETNGNTFCNLKE
jgi:hypothetical protein